MENNDFSSTAENAPEAEQKWEGATIRSLRLKPVVTIKASAEVSAAIEVMREKSYDQLPVLNDGGKLVGLVTLGKIFHVFPLLEIS